MIRFFLSIIAAVAAAWLATPLAQAQSLSVATYNVRYHNSDDDLEGNEWRKRSQVMADLINFEAPDIFGAQEVLDGQLHDLLGLLDGYAYLGVGRDDGKAEGEYSPIFYNKERMALLSNGHFWLSDTPDSPTKGWDAACVRICTWGEFKLTERPFRFFFFNLHMDHVGVVARRESVKLVLERIADIAKGAPVVLTGDFNDDQNGEAYGRLVQSGTLRDAYAASHFRLVENGTFNDFDTTRKTDSRIDHVFVSKQFDVMRYAILTGGYWTTDGDGKSVLRLPSDHYPVFVKLNAH